MNTYANASTKTCWRSPRLKGKDGRFLEGDCLDGLSGISHDRESTPCYYDRKKRRIIWAMRGKYHCLQASKEYIM